MNNFSKMPERKKALKIIKCILRQDDSFTPAMIKRFIDWIQMDEFEFQMKVRHACTISTKKTCKILHCSERTAFRLFKEKRINAMCVTGTRRNGYWGCSLFNLVSGSTDKALRERLRQRSKKRGTPYSKLGKQLSAPNRYNLKRVSRTTVNLICAVFRGYKECFSDEVLILVIAMMFDDMWRFSIPNRFYRILSRKETCQALNLGSTAVQALVRQRKVLKIIGCGKRALGYSGPSVWKYLLERQ